MKEKAKGKQFGGKPKVGTLEGKMASAGGRNYMKAL